MSNYDHIEHHRSVKEILPVLQAKTENPDTSFFSVEVAYFLGKMAASQRASIIARGFSTKPIPVNTYAINLAGSGMGKGKSMGLMERDFLGGFEQIFSNETFPEIAEESLKKRAENRSLHNNTTFDEEMTAVQNEYSKAGSFLFSYSEGTPAGVKQYRNKLILADSGCLDFVMDELGSNLTGQTELLNLYLELYDMGLTKQKITKNTAENTRSSNLKGMTPACMMLFGTEARLFDGADSEKLFYSFLETGYARRCLFGFGKPSLEAPKTSAAERFRKLVDPVNDQIIDQWSSHFKDLADPSMHNWQITMPEEVIIRMLEYKDECEAKAAQLPEHKTLLRTELQHRYFKALKLAGSYAFVDQSNTLSMDHLMSAIKFVEESGETFEQLMNRDAPFMKLAKYLAAEGTDITYPDMKQDLPFFPNSQSARNDMMAMAIAWGYKNNVIIKKSYQDGIEFFQGESLKSTDLNKLTVSYSNHVAYSYLAQKAPFDQLDKLFLAKGMHWANHAFQDEHRKEENVIPGFNLVVLDVDGTATLDMVHDLLKDYTFITYTTKRHTEEANRFRLIIPINYELKLNTDEYREFMNTLMGWLPFEVDDCSNQRSKKWEANANGTIHFNRGELLDALKFIPKTTRNEQYQKEHAKIADLGNLERWFAQRIAEGNRNKELLKYALCVADTGLGLDEVETRVLEFNSKLSNGLPAGEIQNTILRTVAKRYSQQNAA